MDVTIGESEMGSGQASRAEFEPQARDVDVSVPLSERVQAMIRSTRIWVAENPFAALGIAVTTGFVAGRMMRAWVLRP